MVNSPASFANEWARLATSRNPRIRAIAERLTREPAAQRYFPYASHSDIRVSRNTSFPWDDEGLPIIASAANDDELYEASLFDDGLPPVAGGLEAVAQAFLEMLAYAESR